MPIGRRGRAAPDKPPVVWGFRMSPEVRESKTITEWVRRGHVKVYSDEQVNLMDVLVRVGER